LFFALAIQPLLCSLQQSFPALRIIAYLDDIVLQGTHDDVRSGYGELRLGLSQMGLQVQRRKSWVYSPDFDEKDEMMFQLGIPAADRGLIVAGCPVGEPDFVAAHAYAVAEEVALQVQSLMDLQLPAQDKLLLLRKSLQVKVVHFARCVPYDLAAPALQKSEAAVKSAVLSLIGRLEDDIDVEQLYLPLRHGGLGLQRMTELDGVVCRAGYLAAASLTQTALAAGAEGFQPLSAAAGGDLAACWQQVTAFCSGRDNFQLEAQSMLEARQAGELQQLQRRVGGLAQEDLHSRLLDKYKAQLGEATRVHAQEHLARLHSLEQGVGTCWLDVRRVHGAHTTGHTFVPFAIESYGRLGRAAMELLSDWANSVVGDGSFDRASYLVWIKRELSVALTKGNARMFRRYVGMLTQGVGQRFVAAGALFDID
jgi:hypothetical protein